MSKIRNESQLSIFDEENNSGLEKEEIYSNALGYPLPWEEEIMTIQDIEIKLSELREEYKHPALGKSREAIRLQAKPY